MVSKKGGLGKGLGKGIDLLISNEYVEEKKEKEEIVSGSEQMVKIRLVEPASKQPRTYFDEDSLAELSDSIKKYGMIQPIIVKKIGDHYQIVAGERRWRAAKQAGLKEVPVIVKEYSEQEIAEVSLIENLQREDLNPIEEAMAYQALIDKYGLKQDEIAEKVSKSRSVITNALRLLRLDRRVQNMLAEGVISTGHAKVILGLEDKDMQVEAANKVVEGQLSVRATENLIKFMQSKKEEHPKPVYTNDYLYQEIKDKMEKRIGTKVRIKRKGDDNGKIEIEYYTRDDLEKIIEIMQINS